MPGAFSVEALRDALSDPSTFPHAPDRVEVVQTHISVVALVPPWVYKVKKPVDLGFLDFTSLEARRRYCHEEVRLNRRLCEGVYRGVVPIVETDDGLRVDPAEDAPALDAPSVREVAVKMRYMDPEGFLDRRLDRGEAGPGDVDRLVRTLARFYRERTSTPEIAEAGRIDRIRVSTDENFEQTRELVGETLPPATYAAVRDYTDRFFDVHASLFRRRRVEGRVVEGHGDLRLEHVHTGDGSAGSGGEESLCIYDCIEFSERLRRVDVASDIAFLAMDLDLHGRPDLGRRFVDRMGAALDDPTLGVMVDFYKCYRAYVRGKVEGMRAAEGEVPARERAASRQRARRAFQWALRYAVAGSEPLVVVVMGRSATGKSTQARRLANRLGWARLSSDRVRKTRAGVPLHRRPDAAERERLYSRAMTATTYATLRRRALERARRGTGTVLDATYSRRADRDRLREALQAEGVPHAFVELTAPDAVLRERLGARSGASTVSDARADDFDLLTDRYETPDALEDERHVRVRSTDDPDETARAVLSTLIRL
jgi:hypothetical protein